MKGISTEDFKKILPTTQPEVAIEICLANLAVNKEHSLEDKVADNLTFRHVITALNGALEQITSLKGFLNDIFEAGVESGLIRETEVIPDAAETEQSAKEKVEKIREGEEQAEKEEKKEE